MGTKPALKSVACVSTPHPGELVAKKWGTLGSNRLKCAGHRWATKPAKVGRLGPRCAKVRRGLHPAPTRAPPQKGLRSTPRAKLLKWGRLRARVKSAKVRPPPYVYYPYPPVARGAKPILNTPRLPHRVCRFFL